MDQAITHEGSRMEFPRAGRRAGWSDSENKLLWETADEAQLKKLAKVLEQPSFEVVVDLHLGKGESSVYTCDFSLDYVHINADYTT